MTRTRLLILLVGPVVIISLSIALSDWMQSGGVHPSSNIAIAAPPQVLLAAETRSASEKPPELDRHCNELAANLQKRLGASCRVISRPPFVIGGDLSDSELRDWHDRTIGPAARALASCYFRVRPSKPVTVLLFRSADTYERYAQKLFGETGISIYGYYKPHQRTLVMNINTGGGTLVHELTHALVDFDFPEIPDWFNEGLASLHEQCQIHQDAAHPWIEGFENWRLPGLQRAIEQKRLRPLEQLVLEDDFRGQLEGINYAQARYFCLYLQRKGLLEKFYKTFRARASVDRLGGQSVLAVLEGRTWDALDGEFRRWVMTLKQN